MIKTVLEQFKEITGRDGCEVFGFDQDFLVYLEGLNIPERYHNLAFYPGYAEWEIRSVYACHAFLFARELKLAEEKKPSGDWSFTIGTVQYSGPRLPLHSDAEKWWADGIGKIVAEQIVKGNFSAPRIISDGLRNLQNKRPFITKVGRRSSIEDESKIILTLYRLKAEGIAYPSQAELRRHLAEFGYKIGREKVSKIIDKLELNSELSDGREAHSDSGHRRRKKPHVAK